MEELIKRLVVIVVVNTIAMMLLFSQARMLMDYLIEVNPGMKLVYTTPSEMLLVYVNLSFIMALILCSPITVYEIWAFVEKGLYKHEKRYILISLFFGLILFVMGAVFCYFIVLPTTLNFFLKIAITEVKSMISVQSYVSFVNMMLLAFGVIFEMPVVVFLLTKLGLLKPAFLKKNRAYIIIVIFILAAFITPPDVVLKIMLGIHRVVLLELSILVSTLVDKINRKK